MSSTYAAFTLTLPAASATYRGMAWAVSSAGFAVTYSGTFKYSAAKGTWTAVSASTYASATTSLLHYIYCAAIAIGKKSTIGEKMPSKSKKQERFMQISAHNPKFAKQAGISVKVAKEFVSADKRKKGKK